MKSLSFLHDLEEFLANVLFPHFCLGCGATGQPLCSLCQKKIQHLSFQLCHECQIALTSSGELCGHCIKNKTTRLDKLIVSGDYQNDLLAKLIHSYKYKFVKDLSNPLGDFMTGALKKWNLHVPDYIVPVPLHKKRLKWRGFNQSTSLAQVISESITPGIKLPVLEDVIVRTRNTLPQMKLKKAKERKQNINNAFAKTDQGKMISNKNILLVDDVCTTGATIFECSKILSACNPHSITAIVLARQRA